MAQKQFDTRKRIAVYVSAEEYAAIEARAEGNASGYARKVLLASIQDVPKTPDVRAGEREPMPVESTATRDTRRIMDRLPLLGEQVKGSGRAKTCVHGKEKGYHCWQCGGLANV